MHSRRGGRILLQHSKHASGSVMVCIIAFAVVIMVSIWRTSAICRVIAGYVSPHAGHGSQGVYIWPPKAFGPLLGGRVHLQCCLKVSYTEWTLLFSLCRSSLMLSSLSLLPVSPARKTHSVCIHFTVHNSCRSLMLAMCSPVSFNACGHLRYQAGQQAGQQATSRGAEHHGKA